MTQRQALPEMHNPAHGDVFAAFVQAMADELRANAHKGDRAGWLTMNEREAVSEVLYHAAKLAYAARKFKRGEETAQSVREFAADVANCALMVADVCGVLEPSGEQQHEQHDHEQADEADRPAAPPGAVAVAPAAE